MLIAFILLMVLKGGVVRWDFRRLGGTSGRIGAFAGAAAGREVGRYNFKFDAITASLALPLVVYK
jgi:hypothetical protein